MPDYPLYYEAIEGGDLKDVRIILDDEDERRRKADQEIVCATDQYYEPYRAKGRRAGALYNMIQSGTDDVVSNWYLGWARILINHSVAMMSAGVPEGDFQPIGPSDYKRKILWDALASHALNKCNWRSHQRRWLQDLHVFGNAVTRNYSEVPMRKKPFMDKEGNLAHKFVRDYRRAKVGIRVRSPFRCMRSTSIIDPDEIRIGIEREDMPYNTFVIRYKNAVNEDGSLKYETDQVPVAARVQVVHIEDEEENEKRVYALAYGGKTENEKRTAPLNVDNRELGVPIMRTPLSKFKIFGENGQYLAGGENVHGKSSLTWATFDDQLDIDYETHAIWGMGIPDIIEGPEAIMQGLVNMTIDNVRLKNTVPISYIPNDQDSPYGFDLDLRHAYSGLMIDGQVQPNPLGVADVGANSVMWEWLKTIIYQLTGINPEQLTGDNINTAFQSGLLLRQMNMRARDRITSWEDGPFPRMWSQLLADSLSVLTEEEWEEISEEEVEQIKERISNDEMTGEDFRENEIERKDGTKELVFERRRHFYFPVKGRKFREDFTGENKTRTMDPNSSKNTLIEDYSMTDDVSNIPADKVYLFQTGDIERAMEFDTKVTGKHMLLDLKVQDMQDAERLMNLGITLKQVVPDIDLRKQYIETGKIAGFEEDDIMETKRGGSKIKSAVDKIIQDMEAAQQQEAANPPDAAMVSAPGQPVPTGGQPQAGAPEPPQNLQDVANGTI